MNQPPDQDDFFSHLTRVIEAARSGSGEKVKLFSAQLPESGYEASWEKTDRREIFVIRSARGRGKFGYTLFRDTESFVTLERSLREALSDSPANASKPAGFFPRLWMRLWGRSIIDCWCLEDNSETNQHPGLLGAYESTTAEKVHLFRMRGWRQPHVRLLRVYHLKTSGKNTQNSNKFRIQSVGLSLNDARTLHKAILDFAT